MGSSMVMMSSELEFVGMVHQAAKIVDLPRSQPVTEDEALVASANCFRIGGRPRSSMVGTLEEKWRKTASQPASAGIDWPGNVRRWPWCRPCPPQARF